MANKHLLAKPLKASVPKKGAADSAWFYEVPSGLTILARVRCPCGNCHFPLVKLRWDQLSKSLERKDRK